MDVHGKAQQQRADGHTHRHAQLEEHAEQGRSVAHLLLGDFGKGQGVEHGELHGA
ncbi:hypothetical protein D3C73_1620600 [compost metagenome]